MNNNCQLELVNGVLLNNDEYGKIQYEWKQYVRCEQAFDANKQQCIGKQLASRTQHLISVWRQRYSDVKIAFRQRVRSGSIVLQ